MLVVMAAGCQSIKETGSELFSEGSGLEASMAPSGGSVAVGSVKFNPTASGVAMMVHVTGLRYGEQYRVVVHANGNCTSRNGFSAGPPWAPPGASERAMAQMQTPATAGDAAFTMVVRIPGVRMEGPDSLAGKSVVIHSGAQGSLEARPDVANNRVACGVIGPVRSSF